MKKNVSNVEIIVVVIALISVLVSIFLLTFFVLNNNAGVTGNVIVSGESVITYIDYGLSSNKSYNYSVKAFDSSGKVSSDGDVISVTTLSIDESSNCGDSITDSGENCDMGILNGVNGSGCSGACDISSDGVSDRTGTDPSNQLVGMNLHFVKDYSLQLVFNDVFKQSRFWVYSNITDNSWESPGVSVPLTSDGYPIQIPYDPDGAGSLPGQKAKALMFTSIGGHYPYGDYTFSYEGDGNITIYDWRGSAYGTKYSHAGRYVYSLPNANGSNAGVVLTITYSNVSNPVRNISFIMPGSNGNTFNSEFKDRVSSFRVIRYMDFLNTNLNPSIYWENRTRVYNAQQTISTGVAWEYIAALSNELGVDAWVNIPTQANDDYVRNVSLLLKKNLNSNRKIYLEYSNEVWNPAFGANAYSMNQGLALGLASDKYEAGRRFYSMRSAQIFTIFNDTFGSEGNRVVNVIGSQAVNNWTANQLLMHLNNATLNPSGIKADVLAIAPYFADGLADDLVSEGVVDTITIDEFLDRINASVDYWGINVTRSNKVVADRYNVSLVAYEAGFGLFATGANVNNVALTNLLKSAANNSRMEGIYTRFMDLWFQNGGELINPYALIGSHDKYGVGSLLEYQDQPIEEAPMYIAVLDKANALNFI